jgi:hypothetical protein
MATNHIEEPFYMRTLADFLCICAGGARPGGGEPALCPAGHHPPRLEQAGQPIPSAGLWRLPSITT